MALAVFSDKNLYIHKRIYTNASALRNRVKGNNVKASARTTYIYVYIHIHIKYIREHARASCQMHMNPREKKRMKLPLSLNRVQLVRVQPRASDKIAVKYMDRSGEDRFAQSTGRERQRERYNDIRVKAELVSVHQKIRYPIVASIVARIAPDRAEYCQLYHMKSVVHVYIYA